MICVKSVNRLKTPAKTPAKGAKGAAATAVAPPTLVSSGKKAAPQQAVAAVVNATAAAAASATVAAAGGNNDLLGLPILPAPTVGPFVLPLPVNRQLNADLKRAAAAGPAPPAPAPVAGGGAGAVVQNTGSASGKDEIQYRDIVFGSKIGEGAFGDVYRGTLWGQEVAIKTMKGLKRSAIKDFKAEVAIMRRLRHPNIVAYLGASFEKPNLCIVAEYLHNGSLEDLIEKRQKANKKFTYRQTLRISIDIARGLNWLHHKGISTCCFRSRKLAFPRLH